MDNFDDMNRIIYTPTVGWACSHWSHLFKTSRGMYFSIHDKGEMASLVYNWEHDDVDAVVVTDGSRYVHITVWKFQDFFTIQILREISLNLEISKMPLFAI